MAVMPDLIRHPEIPDISCTGFRLEFIRLRRAGMRSRFATNENFSSPEGEGFPPSPIGTLSVVHQADDLEGLLISVIIVTYNRSRELESLLDSFFHQNGVG